MTWVAATSNIILLYSSSNAEKIYNNDKYLKNKIKNSSFYSRIELVYIFFQIEKRQIINVHE